MSENRPVTVHWSLFKAAKHDSELLREQYDEEYAEEAQDDENHEGYAGNEYPDEELLTSDDGRMMSEDSSQEDEDFW